MSIHIDGKKALKLRLSQNMTQKDLASKIGVALSTICFIESEKYTNTSLDTVCKYSDVFKVSILELIDEESSKRMARYVVQHLLFHGVVDTKTAMQIAEFYSTSLVD